MHLGSRPDLTYCVCGERVVFLDIEADRYFCLPPKLNDAFLSSATENANDHAGAGIFSCRGAARTADIPTAMDELAPKKADVPIARAVGAQWLARMRLRRCDFSKVISHERSRQPSSRNRKCEEDLARLYGAFLKIAVWFGDTDQCLARSLAFRMLAFRLGHSPSLVLGVKLDPFVAHCWVQTGSRVENDTLDRVRIFTPILVL